jgi:hypothetical protein
MTLSPFNKSRSEVLMPFAGVKNLFEKVLDAEFIIILYI